MMQGSLARTLRVLRAERGLTQEVAASRIGVTVETLSDLENGKRRAYAPTLTKIARGYGVPVEALVEEERVPLAEALETGLEEPSEEEVAIERSPAVKSWLREIKAPRFALTDVEYQHEWVYPARARGVKGLFAERAALTHEYVIVGNALPRAPLSVPKVEVRRAYWRRRHLIDVEFWRLIDGRLSEAEGGVEVPTDEEIERWRGELSSVGGPRRLAAP